MKWYYGPHTELKNTWVLTRTSTPPSRASHGHCMKFSCGPENTKQDAVNDCRFCFTGPFTFVNVIGLKIKVDEL